MGDGGDLGTLEPGKLADLILVDGDPLADITVLSGPSTVACVIKDGAVVKLSASLAARAGASPALEPAE